MAENEYRVRLLDYLAEFGLDGNEIAADRFTDETYELFTGYVTSGRVVTVTRNWPEGINVEKIRTLLTLAYARDRQIDREANSV